MHGTFVNGQHDEGAAELNSPLLAAFSPAAPNVKIKVRLLEYETAYLQLASKTVDAVVSSAAWRDSDDVRTVTLFNDGRGVLVGPEHELHDADQLAVAEVLDHTILSSWQERNPSEAFFDFFVLGDHRNGDLRFRRATTINNFIEQVHQICTGVAIVGSTASSVRFFNLKPARFIPLYDATPVPLTVAIPDSAPTAAQLLLLEVAEKTAEELRALVPSAV